MPYEIAATSRTPALIIYVVDISGSMDQMLDGQKKIEHVNQAMRRILQKMVQRSTKGEIVSPRYRLGMIAYSDTPLNIFNGVESISEVVKRGRPMFAAEQATNTYAAFKLVRDLLRGELANQQGKPAPMVCHITDGEFTDSDPEPLAKEIMDMKTADGNVLMENIFVGDNLLKTPIQDAESWRGIFSADEIKDDYARKLFRMSSLLPESYRENVEKAGYSLQPGARMLLPCNNRELIELAFAASGATPTR
jgi:uncharacterized protein YegL